MYVCVCVGGGAQVRTHACVCDQLTTCMSQFSPSITWVSGTELKSPDLATGVFTHWVMSLPIPLLRVFKTGSHYVALADLELALQTRLSLNSQRSACSASRVLGLKACVTQFKKNVCLFVCMCMYVYQMCWLCGYQMWQSGSLSFYMWVTGIELKIVRLGDKHLLLPSLFIQRWDLLS